MRKRICYAHEVLRAIPRAGKPLKWLQAERCKKGLAAHLKETRLVDARIAAWALRWRDTSNENCSPTIMRLQNPDWFTVRWLRRAIRAMKARADEILQDPALGVEAP